MYLSKIFVWIILGAPTFSKSQCCPSYTSIPPCFHCCLVSISFCSVTRFISVQCCINLSTKSCTTAGSLFQHSPKLLSELTVETLVTNPCVKMRSYALWTALSQFHPRDSLHCHLGIDPRHQGRKKKKNPLIEQHGHSSRRSYKSIFAVVSCSFP